MSDIITVEDIRETIKDRGAADNEIDRDVTFSDPDIKMAMRLAAAHTRTIPPTEFGNYTADCLPFNMGYIDGVISFLYENEADRLERNEHTTEVTGEQDMDVITVRAKALRRLSEKRLERFERAVHHDKYIRNLRGAWGSF